MKKLLLSLFCLFSLVAMAQPNVPRQMQRSGKIELRPMRGFNNRILTYNLFGNRDMKARGGFAPFFLVYPDQPCDEQQAMKLFADLGLDRLVKDYAGSIGIVNPVGKKWNNEADFQAYKAMIDSMRIISNLKIIAIGSAATFVNQTIARQAGEVAGIVTIGGKPGKVSKTAVPVPAFIGGRNAAKVSQAYIAANKAKAAGKGLYVNSDEPLLRVFVDGSAKTDKELVAEAWEQVLSKNYRFCNFKHTFYTGAKFGQYGPYELEPYADFAALGLERKVIEEDLLKSGKGKYLWYEYVPDGLSQRAAKSVPLVLLLHGHGNDPRTQAETSGWLQVQGKERFMVAELEWQGNGYEHMGLDGIEMVVHELLRKYPQIDPSRIYTEGLSAGAMTSSALGIRKSHLFAAIGAMSGGIFPGGFYEFGGDALLDEAKQKRSYVETAYVGVFGTDDDTIMYPTLGTWKGNSIINAWKLYETMNGMPVVEEYDFKNKGIFGQDMRDSKKEILKNIQVQSGYLYKGNVPLMKLIAVEHYGHWNFQPAARMMWEHFKHFSRDVNTKKLMYTP